MKTDFFGQEINVGDEVVFTMPGYKDFCNGTISGFTVKKVYIDFWYQGYKDRTLQETRNVILKPKQSLQGS